MTNDEIFDTLADNEMKLFYAWCRDPHNDELKAAHAASKAALVAFAKATGRLN